MKRHTWFGGGWLTSETMPTGLDFETWVPTSDVCIPTVQRAEKRRLRRAASRLRGCYLALLAGLAAFVSLASFGAE
jgi:hypothetical protein